MSTWGHDFRPDYKKLASLRTLYPDVPILALTATATSRVREDVVSVLKMRRTRVFVQDFNRPNLIFTVRQKPFGAGSSDAAFTSLLDYIREEHGGDDTGIVYCLSRKDTEELADWLTDRGIASDCYHAGMTTLQRVLVQNAWQRGDTRVVVATIAFGMGIDHPRVRFVVHWSLSKSVEGYYQEAGEEVDRSASSVGHTGQILLCWCNLSGRKVCGHKGDMWKRRAMTCGVISVIGVCAGHA